MQIKLISRLRRYVMASGLMLAPACCWAGDWSIRQDVNLNTNASLSQGASKANSNTIQALNVIKLASGDNFMISDNHGSQNVTLSNTTISLTQSSAGNNNIQAANVLEINVGDGIPQRVTDFSHVTLKQTTTGSGNIQALNVALVGEVDDIAQVVTGNKVTLDNRGVGSSNTQVVNYLHAQANRASGSPPFTLAQQSVLTSLDIFTDGSFNANDRYGQGVNLIIHPNPASPDIEVQQSTTIGTLNINGTGTDPNSVMAVINRVVTP